RRRLAGHGPRARDVRPAHLGGLGAGASRGLARRRDVVSAADAFRVAMAGRARGQPVVSDAPALPARAHQRLAGRDPTHTTRPRTEDQWLTRAGAASAGGADSAGSASS